MHQHVSKLKLPQSWTNVTDEPKTKPRAHRDVGVQHAILDRDLARRVGDDGEVDGDVVLAVCHLHDARCSH